jgi:hypothetical protein
LALTGDSKVDLSPYDLLIVGPDTGAVDGTWVGGDVWVTAVRQSRLPVLGIGHGGYAFYGKLGLAIGYDHGGADTGTSVIPLETSHLLWNEPYDMKTGEILPLYRRATMGVTVMATGADVTWLGARPPNSTPLWLTLERDRFFLWGFRDGPDGMTTVGQALFVNAVWSLLGGGN